MSEPVQGELWPDLKAKAHFVTVLSDMIFSYKMREIGGSALMVYLALKAHTDWRTGDTYPDYETLRDLTGFSQSQIKRLIAALEKAGLIQVDRSHRNNRYELIEKVPIVHKDSGAPHSTATYPYHPHADIAAEVYKQVQHYTATGKLPANARFEVTVHQTIVNNEAGGTVNIYNGPVTVSVKDQELSKIWRALRDID